MDPSINNGFFDLQVNGYAGVDFNQDNLTGEQLHTACEQLQKDGVQSILATIVTEDLDKMAKRLYRLAVLRAQDSFIQNLIAGFHIEGPFINETTGYRGTQPLDAIRPANVEMMQRLLEAAEGLTRIVTLAPECDFNSNLIKLLIQEGITVSAGHTDASLDQLKAAIDHGLSMFTHLGNGCPIQMHRHDNIIQRALSLHDRLWLCFIADGVHIPFPTLGNYLRSASLERCIIVSDALTAASLGPGRYHFSRFEVIVDEKMAAWTPDSSYLIGSAITMKKSFENLQEHLGLTEQQALQLTVHNPKKIIYGDSQKWSSCNHQTTKTAI